MKKLLLHIILFSYAIVMFKPAFPYLNDVIAHALFYHQHMATVHFENGKYHVHKEVVKNVTEENSNKNSLPEKKKNSSSYEYISTLNKSLLPVASLSSSLYAVHQQQHNIFPYLAYNYPPPRA
jgi:hypothetical protein